MELYHTLRVERAKSTNRLPMGEWSPAISYKLSDAGIPVVTVEDDTAAGFSAYSLNVESSTAGDSPAGDGASEWILETSLEFMYMMQAYIERLQAVIVTAEKIESMMIRTKNIEILEGAIIKGSLESVSGTFKTLKAVNNEGKVLGEISFGTDGTLWFSGDMQHQGYNSEASRGYRFLTSDVHVRGEFSHRSRHTIGYVTNDSLNISGITINVYGHQTGTIRPSEPGIAADVVYVGAQSGSATLEFINGATGKEVTVVNSGNSTISVKIRNGYQSVPPYTSCKFVCLHYEQIYPRTTAYGTYVWFPVK